MGMTDSIIGGESLYYLTCQRQCIWIDVDPGEDPETAYRHYLGFNEKPS